MGVLHPLPLPSHILGTLIDCHTPVPTGWLHEKPSSSCSPSVIPQLFGRDECLCGLWQLAVLAKHHLRTALSKPRGAQAPCKGAAFRLTWIREGMVPEGHKVWLKTGWGK